ncbi:MAG: serine/threonine-protein kinase [Acidobacteriota bacterium]
MNDDRWRRVEQLFAAAVDLDDEDRRALLRREGAGDSEVIREVEELLAAESTDVDLISEVVEGAAAELVKADDAKATPHLLGPWRVEERLGEGGTSVVYRATRDDDQFSKQVALKVLKRGMDTDDILRRFAIEKQILARLDHPNIARLLDAGTTPDGRPYFVMELVDGAPIDAYCDRMKLTIDERLELFRHICAAVTYAHRNLVVHRDLKPSNILVNADGVPTLLDFGIAKLLDSESQPQDLEVTAAPFRLLTPGYASPEQIAGKAVTTASDVYSLGVVLYQLLSGLRPYRLTDRSPRDLERLVREQEPRRPSAALRTPPGPGEMDGPAREELSAARGLTVDELARRLRGDLDAVVLRALRKQPEARYSSVERLADDLERHQHHRPVLARHGSFRYQAGRFLRRHRLGVALASAAALVLVIFVSTLIVQRLRLEEERTASERRWHLAEEVKEFLIDLFPMTDADGANMTARELLDRGAEIAMHENHPPEIRAARLDTVGRVSSSDFSSSGVACR